MTEERRYPGKEEYCGFGGTFAIKYPHISNAMVEDKAKAINETCAQLLVNGDCGCLMNITGHMEQQSSDPKGQHIASFIWEHTHADGDFHLSVDDVLSNHKVRELPLGNGWAYR